MQVSRHKLSLGDVFRQATPSVSTEGVICCATADLPVAAEEVSTVEAGDEASGAGEDMPSLTVGMSQGWARCGGQGSGGKENREGDVVTGGC